MKKWKGIVALALAVLTLAALAVPSLAATTIGTSKAKEIALGFAGIESSAASNMSTRLTRDDGVKVYDVKFRSNGVRYEFEINAETGAIREYERSRTASSSSSSSISVDAAQEIALASAGVNAADATFVRAKLDYEDGRKVYEVEFYAGNLEYDYEIDAASGTILSFDQDAEYYRPTTQPSQPTQPSTGTTTKPSTGSSISLEQAKQIALNHAGVNGSEANFVRAKLDYDDGRKVYEVEFYVGNYEYDYEIDAYNGRIRDFDRDAEYYTPKKSSSSSSSRYGSSNSSYNAGSYGSTTGGSSSTSRYRGTDYGRSNYTNYTNYDRTNYTNYGRSNYTNYGRSNYSNYSDYR